MLESENRITREVEREPEKGILKVKVKRISRKSVVADALLIQNRCLKCLSFPFHPISIHHAQVKMSCLGV